jgi:phosphoglycolate phosphatase-like HAD superfamily hydrolase
MHIFLFDIDGTLISSGGAGKAALERGLASEFGIDRVIGKLELSGRTDRAIVHDLLSLHGLEVSEANRRRVLVAYLRHLPECLTALKGKVLPGIAELLVRLCRREDVVVGLLTGNVRDGARVKLGHFRLFDHFACGGFGDAHLDRNDVAREALEAVQAHLRRPVAPDRFWVIGDTPLDVRCARHIGARAVAVGTGWHSMAELAESKPDLLLADLSEPGPLLACLNGMG